MVCPIYYDNIHFLKFFLKFIAVNSKIQLLIIIILMLFSLIIHRRYDNNIFALFHNVIYFTPIYLLGIFVSKNIKLFYSKMNGKEFYLLVMSFLIILLQVQLGRLESIRELNEISIKYLDLMIIQKSLISLFLLIYFNKFEHKNIRLLKLLAENSYGIFFIHGLYIWLINVFILKFQIKYISNSLFIFFITANIVITLSLLTTLVIKKILSKKSKYVIGC